MREKNTKKKSTKKKPHVRGKRVEKELKKDQKKLQNRMKNATIEIVAGHSEQNEPVFVCVGREYRIYFCVSTDSYAKKQKRIENWPCQRNIADQGTRMHRFCLRREYSFLRKKTKN